MIMDPDRVEGAGPPTGTAQRVGRVVVALALVLLGLYILQDFLAALAWAAIFAIASWGLYRRLAEMLPPKARHHVAPLLMTLLIACVFVGPLVYLAIVLAREMHVVVELVAEARRGGIPVPGWVSEFPVVGHTIGDWWRSNLSDPYTADELLGRINHVLAESGRQYGAEIARRLTLFVFTLLTLFFLFRDGTLFTRELLVVSDRLLGVRGERLARQMIGAVHGTVNGLVLVGLGEGVVLGLVYVFAGVPHAVSVGAATGVLAVIPFGAPVIFGAAGLYLLAQGATVPGIVVFVAGMVVVFIADHFIRPFLIGGHARLPFLWVLLGILGGLETFGFLGLFLGPAVMAALIELWREGTEAPPGVIVTEGVGTPASRPMPRPAPAQVR